VPDARPAQSRRLSRYRFLAPVIAGVRIPREQTLELAAMLTRDGSDHTARVLLEAITNGHELVALTNDDREAILAVLDHPPEQLVELRRALFADLAWRRSGLVSPRPAPHGFPAARRMTTRS